MSGSCHRTLASLRTSLPGPVIASRECRCQQVVESYRGDGSGSSEQLDSPEFTRPFLRRLLVMTRSR